jgi:hypothetical protein
MKDLLIEVGLSVLMVMIIFLLAFEEKEESFTYKQMLNQEEL